MDAALATVVGVPGDDGVPPPHARVAALETAFRHVDRALRQQQAYTDPVPASVAALCRWTETSVDEDDTLFVQRTEPVSTHALGGLLRLRLDLARHEPAWRNPRTGRFARLALDDVVPASCRGHFAAVDTDNAPVLFWSVRRVVALLAILVEHRRTLPFDTVMRPLVLWGSRRAAMLLTYTFDGATHDVPEYRQAVARDPAPLRALVPDADDASPMAVDDDARTFRASLAAVWDVVALLVPLWQWTAPDACAARPVVVLADAAQGRADAAAFTRRVVAHMQGDTLPIKYQHLAVASAVRPHHAAWFRRRRPRAHAPRAMDLLQECAGTGFAAQVHQRAARRLRDVVAADPLETELLQACAAYYAVQKRLPSPVDAIRWSVPHNAYGLAVHGRVEELVTASYADALAVFARRRWPVGELVGAKEGRTVDSTTAGATPSI